MLTFKRTILILTCFLMAGCIGPFYNPYPISKLVAKVGPPLKLNTMSVEEQINAEIQAEAKTESSDEISQNSEDNNAESSDVVPENSNELNISVVDEKTIIAQWQLDLKENLILPP